MTNILLYVSMAVSVIGVLVASYGWSLSMLFYDEARDSRLATFSDRCLKLAWLLFVLHMIRAVVLWVVV